MGNTLLKKAVCLALGGCLFTPAIGISATTEELERRLQRLEEEVKIANEEAADSAQRYKNAMSIGGYTDIEYVATNQTGKSSGFRMHHLSLMFKKQVNEDLKFFSEFEYEDAPYLSGGATATTGSGKIFVEAMNFDYALNNATTVRVGRFFTPAGIWSVDHYPPYVVTQERPQFIRKIFPQLTDGAAVTGNHAIGATFVNYNLFVGNGETTVFDGSNDNNANLATGLRVNVSLPMAKVFDVGATWYHEKVKMSTTDATRPTKDAYGVHAKIRQGSFGFQAEFAKGTFSPTLGATAGTSFSNKGLYGQFSYDIAKWTLGYRYDFYDPASNVMKDNTKTNSLFVNYHVDQNTVLKLEQHSINLQNPATADYFKSIASIVVNFD